MQKQFIFAIFLIAACAYRTWTATTFDKVKREFSPPDACSLVGDDEVIQRLAFSAEGQGWRMDGKEFARGNEEAADEIWLGLRGAGVRVLEKSDGAATGRLK